VEKGSLERIQEYEPEFTLMRMFEDESQWVFLKSGKFNFHTKTNFIFDYV
jgi:hypothetical protein